jgi:hypothetical protein
VCEGIYVLGNGNWEDPADRGSVESGQWPLCDVMGWMLGRNSGIAFRNFVDYWLERMIILMWYLANFDTRYIIVRNDEIFKKNKFKE